MLQMAGSRRSPSSTRTGQRSLTRGQGTMFLRWQEVRRNAVLLRVFGDNPLSAEFNYPLVV